MVRAEQQQMEMCVLYLDPWDWLPGNYNLFLYPHYQWS